LFVIKATDYATQTDMNTAWRLLSLLASNYSCDNVHEQQQFLAISGEKKFPMTTHYFCTDKQCWKGMQQQQRSCTFSNIHYCMSHNIVQEILKYGKRKYVKIQHNKENISNNSIWQSNV